MFGKFFVELLSRRFESLTFTSDLYLDTDRIGVHLLVWLGRVDERLQLASKDFFAVAVRLVVHDVFEECSVILHLGFHDLDAGYRVRRRLDRRMCHGAYEASRRQVTLR